MFNLVEHVPCVYTNANSVDQAGANAHSVNNEDIVD